MPRTIEQCRRLATEDKLLKRYMPNCHFFNRMENTYIEGLFQTSEKRNCYTLRLTLPSDFPYQEPDLYVVNPQILWQYGRKETVNSAGTSHAFHTYDNGASGYVKICHTGHWHSGVTCIKVILKGIIWLEAYEAHFRTGKNLAHFLC